MTIALLASAVQAACQRGASKSASVQPCVPGRDRSIAGQGGREPSRRDRPPDAGAEPPSDRRHRPADGLCRSLPHAPRLPARLWTAATGDPTKRACGSGGVNVDLPARGSGGPSQAARERPLCTATPLKFADLPSWSERLRCSRPPTRLSASPARETGLTVLDQLAPGQLAQATI